MSIVDNCLCLNFEIPIALQLTGSGMENAIAREKGPSVESKCFQWAGSVRCIKCIILGTKMKVTLAQMPKAYVDRGIALTLNIN